MKWTQITRFFAGTLTPFPRVFLVPFFQNRRNVVTCLALTDISPKDQGQKGHFDPRITYGGSAPLVAAILLVRCRCAEHREPGIADLLLLGVRQLAQEVVHTVLVGPEEHLIHYPGVSVV